MRRSATDRTHHHQPFGRIDPVRTPLLTAALATSSAALCVLTPLAAHAAASYPAPRGGHHGPHHVEGGPLQPDQLIVCSHGAHSDVIIDNLTTPSDTPNPGSALFSIPKDTCRTIVDVPDGNYPIDGTYHVYLQGFKERPLACEDVTHDPDCKLPFHHLELTHASQPGVVNIDNPEATVTISSLDGVRVDFRYIGDYRGADRHTDEFHNQNPEEPPNGY
jgi:hypothetical protein